MSLTTAPRDPPLEDGRAATTPPGDNVLADFVRAAALAYRTIAERADGRTRVDDELGLSLGDSGSPCYFGNVAYASRPLDAAAAEEAVRRVRAFYSAERGGPFLVFTPWSLGDLDDRGFELAGHPLLMLRSPVPADAPEGAARIVDARTPAEVADFDQTLTEAYPAEALLPYGTQLPLFTEGIVRTRWHLVTAHLGDQPVATAAAFATDDVVAIEAVSVRPSFRRHGLGALVTAAAVATAPDLPAALLASDDGRPVYARLGFLPVMRFDLWIGSR